MCLYIFAQKIQGRFQKIFRIGRKGIHKRNIVVFSDHHFVNLFLQEKENGSFCRLKTRLFLSFCSIKLTDKTFQLHSWIIISSFSDSSRSFNIISRSINCVWKILGQEGQEDGRPCRGITRIHRSPSRPRPSSRLTATLINIMSTLYNVS